jgi:hypothetical protein
VIASPQTLHRLGDATGVPNGSLQRGKGYKVLYLLV